MSCLVVRCRSCAPVAAAELTNWLEERLAELRERTPRLSTRVTRLDQELPDAFVEDGWLIEVELEGERPEEPFASLMSSLEETLRDLRVNGSLALTNGVGLVARGRVTLIGEFDLSSLDVLQRSLTATTDSPVVVDLSACSFLDAGVIAYLVGRAQAAGANPERFRLVGAGGQVERILSLTGVGGTAWVCSEASHAPEAEWVAA